MLLLVLCLHMSAGLCALHMSAGWCAHKVAVRVAVHKCSQGPSNPCMLPCTRISTCICIVLHAKDWRECSVVHIGMAYAANPHNQPVQLTDSDGLLGTLISLNYKLGGAYSQFMAAYFLTRHRAEGYVHACMHARAHGSGGYASNLNLMNSLPSLPYLASCKYINNPWNLLVNRVR